MKIRTTQNVLIGDIISTVTSIDQQNESTMTISKTNATSTLAAALLATLSMTFQSPVRANDYFQDLQDLSVQIHEARSSGFNAASVGVASEEDGLIACEESISGTLGEVDDARFSEDGPYVDVFSFEAPQSGQGYRITVQSPDFPGQSAIFSLDSSGRAIPIQSANVFVPEGQVEYSGALEQPGPHSIIVHSADSNPDTVGAYTVTLTCEENAQIGGGTGTSDDPFVIGFDEPVNAELTAADEPLQDQNGGIHYTKFFKPAASSGVVNVQVGATNYTPVIAVFDVIDESLQVIDLAAGSISVDYTSTMVIGVTSDEAEGIGAFSIQMTQDGSSEGLPGPN